MTLDDFLNQAQLEEFKPYCFMCGHTEAVHYRDISGRAGLEHYEFICSLCYPY